MFLLTVFGIKFSDDDIWIWINSSYYPVTWLWLKWIEFSNAPCSHLVKLGTKAVCKTIYYRPPSYNEAPVTFHESCLMQGYHQPSNVNCGVRSTATTTNQIAPFSYCANLKDQWRAAHNYRITWRWHHPIFWLVVHLYCKTRATMYKSQNSVLI